MTPTSRSLPLAPSHSYLSVPYMSPVAASASQFVAEPVPRLSTAAGGPHPPGLDTALTAQRMSRKAAASTVSGSSEVAAEQQSVDEEVKSQPHSRRGRRGRTGQGRQGQRSSRRKQAWQAAATGQWNQWNGPSVPRSGNSVSDRNSADGSPTANTATAGISITVAATDHS